MTVAELIEQLKNMPQDMMVVVPGYEGGYDNPEVKLDSMIPNANWDGKGKKRWYDGRHEQHFFETAQADKPPMKCVIVSRGI